MVAYSRRTGTESAEDHHRMIDRIAWEADIARMERSS